MTSRILHLALCLLFLLSSQPAWASWQYTNGQTGTQGGFTYQVTVTETAANTFSGTATLTAFSGSSASIPGTVFILITVNTTNSQGQPIQYNEWVNCTVKGFSDFTLNSDASFSGNVNIIGDFNLNGNDLTVSGDVIHQSGWLSFGTLPQGSSDPDIRLEITGDYLQQRDADNNGSYETYSSGYLSMNAPSGYMLVAGSALFWNPTGSSLDAGTLEIKGNFTQKTQPGNGWSYSAGGTERTLLSGTERKRSLSTVLRAVFSTSLRSPIPIRWCLGRWSKRIGSKVPRSL